MTTRCKFVCAEVLQSVDGFTSKFMAVYQGSPENEEFFKYTPNATLVLGTVKDNRYVPGKEYYLDIMEA